MAPNLKLPAHFAITSLMSLALCATLGVGQANANDTTAKSKTTTRVSSRGQDRMSGDRMKSGDHMMDGDRMMDGDEMTPEDYDRYNLAVSPLNYPEAVPGGIDMYYWKDLKKQHMRTGSAAEAAFIRRYRRMEFRLSKEPIMEAEEDLMGAPLSYPEAVPGGADLYYWKDLSRTHMRTGSAAERNWIRRYRKMEMRLSKEPMRDEEQDLLPAAPSYPSEAPGNLDMYYWNDFTRMHQRSGSAMDARDSMMHKMNDKRPGMDKMKK